MSVNLWRYAPFVLIFIFNLTRKGKNARVQIFFVLWHAVNIYIVLVHQKTKEKESIRILIYEAQLLCFGTLGTLLFLEF